jgi:hypothetical protein
MDGMNARNRGIAPAWQEPHDYKRLIVLGGGVSEKGLDAVQDHCTDLT